MTAVRFEVSIRYAGRLFLFLVGVTVLGAAGVVLGLGLGWPETLGWDWLARTVGSTDGGVAYQVGGAALVVGGTTIVAIGYLSGAYKLLADAVATGAIVGRRASADGTTATTRVAGTEDPSPDRHGVAAPDEPEIDGPSVPDEPATDPDPPEPSPEEIAFGTDDGDELSTDASSTEAAREEETQDQPAEGAVRPAGGDAPSDPLGDVTDDG